MPLLFKDIKVGGTYILVKCAAEGISCIHKSREVTVARIADDDSIHVTGVTFLGMEEGVKPGWAVACADALRTGLCVLEAVPPLRLVKE